MSGRPLPIVCVDCNEPGLHGGRGLCASCYNRHTHEGTLARFPSVRHNAEWQRTRRLPAAATKQTSHNEPGGDILREEAAACRRHDDPEIFFPVSYHSHDQRVQQAKAVCRACPVLAACTAWVGDNPQDHGIWAATTPSERRRARAAEFERTSI